MHLFSKFITLSFSLVSIPSYKIVRLFSKGIAVFEVHHPVYIISIPSFLKKKVMVHTAKLHLLWALQGVIRVSRLINFAFIGFR